MNTGLQIGLGIGCMIVGSLMGFISIWFAWNGLKDKDKVSVVLGLAILGVAVFAFISAYNFFTKY